MSEINKNAQSLSKPEARYAYYRRCQHFRKNGQQCKAPAVKPMCCGEREFRQGGLCWAHAGQLSVERKRETQRRELLTRPGLGYGDPKTIQRTLSAACQALIDNQIDEKCAGRLAWEMQTALMMFRGKPKFGFLNQKGYGGTRRDRRNRAQSQRNRRNRKARAYRGWRGRTRIELGKA